MEKSTHIPLKSILESHEFTDLSFSDIEVWVRYPEHHQVYNKLWIAETQGIPCGPMGLYPQNYPVIFKPIINLYGMSRGVKVVNSDEEYDLNLKDGLFWSNYLTGIHRCIDLVVRNGEIIFASSLISHSSDRLDGSFDYHESDPSYEVGQNIRDWVGCFLEDYTGCLNLETIDDQIIEMHLRLNGDTHLYDYEFGKQLIRFFEGSDRIEYDIKNKYLIPLFVDKDFNSDDLSEDIYEGILKICDEYRILSVEFDNTNSRTQSEHRSRLLMLESDNLELGLACRDKIIDVYI